MAEKKKPTQLAKEGRKTPNEKLSQDQQLKELWLKGGYTPTRASITVGCGYEYAVKKFQEFGRQVTEAEQEDWIERNDAVRKRELESLSLKIIDAETDIMFIQKKIEENNFLQSLARTKTVDEIKDSPIGQKLLGLVNKFDQKEFMILLSIMRKFLDLHARFSFLITQDLSQLRASKVFRAELQQQYAAIEILPPLSAVLDALMEKHIAEKNAIMKVAVPEQKIKDKYKK